MKPVISFLAALLLFTFSGLAVADDCYEEQEGFRAGTVFVKGEAIADMVQAFHDAQTPAQKLLSCFSLALAPGGSAQMLWDLGCNCASSAKELCSWDADDFEFDTPDGVEEAWCWVFYPFLV